MFPNKELIAAAKRLLKEDGVWAVDRFGNPVPEKGMRVVTINLANPQLATKFWNRITKEAGFLSDMYDARRLDTHKIEVMMGKTYRMRSLIRDIENIVGKDAEFDVYNNDEEYSK